jgi:hypothetical protein
MTTAKHITGPARYASSDDFRQVFDEHMNSLYLLAFLLTADQDMAERCFVSGLEDAVQGNPVFKQWAQSWARRAVIRNAARVVGPRPERGNGHIQSSSDPVNSNGKVLPSAQPVEIASVLGLEPFERFVDVITVLESYSDQDCAVLLGCLRRNVLAARTHALQQIASEAAKHSAQRPIAGRKIRHQASIAIPHFSC